MTVGGSAPGQTEDRAGTTPDSAAHRRFLDEQAAALVEFATGSVRADGGFWWLDERGRPEASEPLHTWIASRMTHVFALAALRGDESAAAVADHGIAALVGLHRDRVHGGWYASVAPSGEPVDDTKAAYPHAFVVLAASTATRAGRPGARELLDEALEVFSARFWDDGPGRTRESWDRGWGVPEPYRGANSSMHTVEAFLAAGEATGDDRWYARALRICEHLIRGVAGARGWRLPEHYTPEWEPLPEFHADRPADPFRPYGWTVGHALEWSRLLLHVEAALPASAATAWLPDAARALFGAAVERGWGVDGADGFVYTLGWDDRPVVHERMHWVVAEGIGAAAVLHARLGDDAYQTWYRRFWDFARRYLLDPALGSWHHELDRRNRPAATVWHGKPDVYHAYQACLLPTLPSGGTLTGLSPDGPIAPRPSRAPSLVDAQRLPGAPDAAVPEPGAAR